MDDMDALYGACRSPHRLDSFETRQPKSLLKLDSQGVGRFQAYLQAAQRGDYLAREFFENFTTLWLIDEAGDVLVALEEGIRDEPLDSFPLPRESAPPSNGRLGHPALVSGSSARIGGELSIRCDPWEVYIDNKSGRFGRGREREMLDNAGELFHDLGIAVIVRYLAGTLS